MNRLLDGSGYAGIGMSLINWLISSTLLAVSANIVLTLFFIVLNKQIIIIEAPIYSCSHHIIKSNTYLHSI